MFRVDNPHTKPAAFWEWLIREVRRKHPEVIFLAEAFTRPSMMTTLAKLGFAQSYTYFTWKNTKSELQEYMLQLVAWSEFYRPNAFVNTPDILHEYLQVGGPPAFEARLVLAATLSPSFGIYSGFESFENVPVQAGSEEYLDSEKYEVKQRTLDGPLLPLVQTLNQRAACRSRRCSGSTTSAGSRRRTRRWSRTPRTTSSASSTSIRLRSKRACASSRSRSGSRPPSTPASC